MYAIVRAAKGSYDSNIKISVVDRFKNKPEAVKNLTILLKDELLSRMNDSDLAAFEGKDLDKEIISFIEEKAKVRETRINYHGEEDYIQLDYNRLKTLSGYTIPCSVLNEYQAETVAIVSAQ